MKIAALERDCLRQLAEKIREMTNLMMDLAMVGTGLSDHVGTACRELIRETTLVEPRNEAHQVYQRYYQF